MSSLLEMVRLRAAYFFIAVGVAWGVLAFLLGSALSAWPTAACLVAGALLLFRPFHRLTWAWGPSTAVMGLIISLYQLYAWEPLLRGAFSGLAAEAIAGFAVFAGVHVVLFYAGSKAPRALTQATG